MKSPLAYIGGKSKLAPTIVEMIPEHKTYCEVFTGAGWVFFRKEPTKYEILNDKDSDLISLYRVLQNHLEEFLKQFKFLLSSREWFEDWKKQIETPGLTDIQRAARYYYIQRQASAGKVKGRSFGAAVDRNPRINLVRMEEELSAVHLRLVNVVIENLSWEKFVKVYDRPKTFFYLDPPYYNKPCYKHNFESLDDFKNLADVLGRIKGRFLLSINDHPDIREVFKGFQIKPVSLKYTASKGGNVEGKELLIANYK